MARHGEFTMIDLPGSKCNMRVDRYGWDNPMATARHFYDYDLTALPKGDVELACTWWRLPDSRHRADPTIISLAGFGSQAEGDSVKEIPVLSEADWLFFLHAYNPSPLLDDTWRRKGRYAVQQEVPENPEIFAYIIHYADDQTARIPIHYGKQVDNWSRNSNGMDFAQMPAPSDCEIAWWFNPEQSSRSRYRQIAVYKYGWKNPRPDTKIQSIDIVSANKEGFDYGSPLLLAITAGTE